MKEAAAIKTPLARLDLAACYAYIGQRSESAAHRFRVAAEQTFELLASRPGIGEPYELANPRLQGLRCAPVRRFRNYLIFYMPITGGIEVIRVLHAARDIRALFEEDE